MATPVAPSLNVCGVLSENKRIINAHSRHFLALAILFLLPLSFSVIIYPTLVSTISHSQSNHHTQTLLRHTSDHSLKTLAIPLVFSLFVLLLSLSATATITYSTFCGFYGRPVKLADAIKSLSRSFFPLLSTTIASQTIILLIGVVFGIFLFLYTKAFETLGLDVNYISNSFQGACIVLSIILVFIMLHLQVNWSLASVIAVVESKWWFEPLRRSSYLVEGMGLSAFSLLLLFGWIIGFYMWVFSTPSLVSFGDASKCFLSILKIVGGSSVVTMFMLNYLASSTVLYMYCKAKHGELALEIAQEFAREYVSLPFDDAKLPHVVHVAEPLTWV